MREGRRRWGVAGTDRPQPRHVYEAKARLRRLVPFVMGSVLEKVKKDFVTWTVEHWGEEVELVGENDLDHMT